MNKRLSFEQKAELAYKLLIKSGRSMSAYEIGKHYGYSGGKAFREVLEWMVDSERASMEWRKNRMGSARYYRINPVYAYHRRDDIFAPKT